VFWTCLIGQRDRVLRLLIGPSSTSLRSAAMDSKYYSSCLQKQVLSSFLKHTSSDLGSKIFSTCIPCRARNSKKRKALQLLCPNVPSKRRAIRPTEALPPLPESRPLFEARTRPPLLPVQTRPRQPILPVYPLPILPIQPQALPPAQPHLQPQPTGFLPAEQREYRQSFLTITTRPLESDTPATTYRGLMPNSSVSIWVMEIIADVRYLFTASTITTAKLDTTVTDFAK